VTIKIPELFVRKTVLIGGVLVAAVYFVSFPLWADGIVRIVAIETDQPSLYLSEVEKGKAILRRLEANVEISVLQAKFAGPETGTVPTVMRFADLNALADDSAKMAQDAYALKLPREQCISRPLRQDLKSEFPRLANVCSWPFSEVRLSVSRPLWAAIFLSRERPTESFPRDRR
jgi:hypothetical protein